MRLTILTLFISCMVLANSTPILSLKDVSESANCSTGLTCIELSYDVLDEISDISIKYNKVKTVMEGSDISTSSSEELFLDPVSGKKILIQVPDYISSANGDGYRFNLEVVYSNSGKKVSSGYTSIKTVK